MTHLRTETEADMIDIINQLQARINHAEDHAEDLAKQLADKDAMLDRVTVECNHLLIERDAWRRRFHTAADVVTGTARERDEARAELERITTVAHAERAQFHARLTAADANHQRTRQMLHSATTALSRVCDERDHYRRQLNNVITGEA